MQRKGASDHDKNSDQNRNRSRSPVKHDKAPFGSERPPVYSFHEMMTKRGQSRHTFSSQQNSSPSPPRGDDGRYGGANSSYPREEEEGMIPQD